jgi:hypothetical protein
VAGSTGTTARRQGMNRQHAHRRSGKKKDPDKLTSGKKLGVDVKFRLNHVSGIDERQGRWCADFNILIGWEIHHPNDRRHTKQETSQETRFFSSPTSQSPRRVLSEPTFSIPPDAGDVDASDETKREAQTKRVLEAETKRELEAELDVFFDELKGDRNCEKDQESAFITFKEFSHEYQTILEFITVVTPFFDTEGPVLLFNESTTTNDTLGGEKFIMMHRHQDRRHKKDQLLTVWFNQRMIVQVEEVFNFQKFPFDHQIFSLHGYLGRTTGYEFRLVDRAMLNEWYWTWHDFHYYNTGSNSKRKKKEKGAKGGWIGNSKKYSNKYEPFYRYPHESFKDLTIWSIGERVRMKRSMEFIQPGWDVDLVNIFCTTYPLKTDWKLKKHPGNKFLQRAHWFRGRGLKKSFRAEVNSTHSDPPNSHTRRQTIMLLTACSLASSPASTGWLLTA